MPLRKGKSQAVISQNIREMSKTHPHDQSVAAALRMAREAKASGGSVWGVLNRALGGRSYATGGVPTWGRPEMLQALDPSNQERAARGERLHYDGDGGDGSGGDGGDGSSGGDASGNSTGSDSGSDASGNASGSDSSGADASGNSTGSDSGGFGSDSFGGFGSDTGIGAADSPGAGGEAIGGDAGIGADAMGTDTGFGQSFSVDSPTTDVGTIGGPSVEASAYGVDPAGLLGLGMVGFPNEDQQQNEEANAQAQQAYENAQRGLTDPGFMGVEAFANSGFGKAVADAEQAQAEADAKALGESPEVTTAPEEQSPAQVALGVMNQAIQDAWDNNQAAINALGVSTHASPAIGVLGLDPTSPEVTTAPGPDAPNPDAPAVGFGNPAMAGYGVDPTSVEATTAPGPDAPTAVGFGNPAMAGYGVDPTSVEATTAPSPDAFGMGPNTAIGMLGFGENDPNAIGPSTEVAGPNTETMTAAGMTGPFGIGGYSTNVGFNGEPGLAAMSAQTAPTAEEETAPTTVGPTVTATEEETAPTARAVTEALMAAAPSYPAPNTGIFGSYQGGNPTGSPTGQAGENFSPLLAALSGNGNPQEPGGGNPQEPGGGNPPPGGGGNPPPGGNTGGVNLGNLNGGLPPPFAAFATPLSFPHPRIPGQPGYASGFQEENPGSLPGGLYPDYGAMLQAYVAALQAGQTSPSPLNIAEIAAQLPTYPPPMARGGRIQAALRLASKLRGK